jgi:hypothetical protein
VQTAEITFSPLAKMGTSGSAHRMNLFQLKKKQVLNNTIFFFCADWNELAGGKLIRDRIDQFLEAYQKKSESLGGIGPLNALA